MSIERDILVSVIIPMYNAEAYIEETINSVLNQTWNNIELIIVDDGSTDLSLTIVKRYECSNVIVVKQNNLGAPVARNLGFKLSHGKYIQYLDADDVLSKNKIEKQVYALYNENERTLSTCTFFQWWGENKQNEWERLKYVNKDYNCGAELQRDLWKYYIPSYVPSCYLTPRKLIEEAGEWDVNLKKNQDGEFFSRVLMNVKKVVFVNDIHVLWRWVPTSISHSFCESKLESELRSYNLIGTRLLEWFDNSAVTKEAVSVAMGNFIYNDATSEYAISALEQCSNWGVSPAYPTNKKVFKILTALNINPIKAKYYTNLIDEYRSKCKMNH